MNDSARPIDQHDLLDQRGWMRRLVAELVADPHAREDVLQETLCVALERPPRTHAPRALRAWLATVLRNRARQGQRSAGLRSWHEARRATELSGGRSALDERLELEARLSSALRALREPYREAIVLRYLDGLGPRQLARELGISEDAARQRVSRGLARLRERLDGDYGARGAWCTVGAAGAAQTSRVRPCSWAWVRGLRGAGWKVVAGTTAAGALPLLLWARSAAAASPAAGLHPRVEAGVHSADLDWTPPERVGLRRQVAGLPAPGAQDPGPATATATATEVPGAVDAYLGPLVDVELFSGAVLLARGGELVHSRAYGKAHVREGQDNATDTRFKLMSVTKSFTAVALMTLEQAGKLELDDPAMHHLHPWPEGWEAVTVRQLASHTSGIQNLEREWGIGARQRGLRGLELWRALAAEVADRPLAAQPGTQTSYSNFNFVLLAALVEAVSGKPFEDYLRSVVLDPAGLEHTGHDDGTRFAALSMGYFRARDGGLEESAQDMSVIRGAGDLYSSTLDLYRLDRALRGSELLAPETRAKMLTPVNGNFALGWQVSRVLGRECVHHSGGANGYVADFLRFPTEDACVIVLSNFAFAPAGRISADLAAILFDEPYAQPVRLERAELDRHAGTYSNAEQPGRTLLVQRSGDVLLAFDVQEGVERCSGNLLIALGDGVFALPWLDAQLEFDGPAPAATPDAGSIQPARLDYRVGNRTIVMTRTPVDELSWRAAVGAYDCEPRVGSAVSIVETGAGFELRIEEGWPALLELSLVSPDRAIARPAETFGTQLHLLRNTDGDVLGFRWERADGMHVRGTRKR